MIKPKLTPEKRLHQLPVPIIGLTGGIATGKSTVSQILVNKGAPVIDADRLVKSIYQLQETKDFVKSKCPEAIIQNKINFPLLREHFFTNPPLKQDLENYIYQRLPKAFKDAYDQLNAPSYVIYDVPLLFEKGLDQLVDLKVLVYAPRAIQKERLMKRDGQKEEIALRILDQQMGIEEKKSKCDYIISNTAGIEELAAEVESFMRQVLN